MDDQQQFCLRWNDFQTNMVASFKHLRDEKSFTDVTIACDGQSTKAHKMILSACRTRARGRSTPACGIALPRLLRRRALPRCGRRALPRR